MLEKLSKPIQLTALIGVTFITSTLTTGASGAAVYGSGTDACSNWTDHRESGGDWQRGEQWVLGYLTGVTDNASATTTETDSDAAVAYLDNYCQLNPQHNLAQAARSMIQPPGISVAGLGGAEGELGNQSQMNQICRTSYPDKSYGSFPVRWATTTDFREYSSYKGWNNDMTEIDSQVALRADSTIFTGDSRAYDQATGTISGRAQNPYPGAVLITENGARFSGRRITAKPLCVWGPPNSDLR